MNSFKEKAVAVIFGIVAAAALLELSLTVLGYLQKGRSGPENMSGEEQRVLCLGDSFVFGVGASSDQSFPAQLEELLNAGRGGRPFKVINAGVQGQNTSQLLAGLPRTLAKYRPSVVVLLSGGSNIWNYRGYYRYLKGNTPLALLGETVSRIHVYKLAKLMYMRLKAPRPQSETFDLKRINANRATEYCFGEIGRIDPANQFSPRLIYAYQNNVRRIRMSEAYNGSGRRPLLLRLSLPWFINPNEEIVRRGRKAFDLLEAGRTPAAVEAFKLLIRLDPGNLEFYHTLTLAYMRTERWKEAFDTCRAGILAALEDENNRNYENIIYLNQMVGEKNKKMRRTIRDFLLGLRDKNDVDNPMLLGALEIMYGSQKESARAKVSAWVEHDLKEIVEICRANGARVVLVNYPERIFANAVIKRAARACDVPLSDITSVFGGILLAHGREEYFIPDGHCNARGYGIVAGTIHKVLLDRGYVSGPLDKLSGT